MTESPLDKVLRLAAPGMTEPAALGGAPSEDEAHEHLMRECPWYQRVSQEKCCSDPDEHCPSEGASSGLVVKFSAELTAVGLDGTRLFKPVLAMPSRFDNSSSSLALTPRTPEASTVDQPTVPPGGPGLFHVKGMHLPPYVQHLYTHLVARYGKHGAYRVAVGVVKKWEAGINPGGKKPTHTHPDVRAAAAKNIAEWEADKVRAHGSHVKASAPQPAPLESGKKLLPLPPPPKSAAAMMTAHRAHDLAHGLAHGVERFDAACATRNGDHKAYHVTHLRNHLARVQGSGRMLADNLRRNYPAEGKELDAVMGAICLAGKSLSPAIKAATTAHLLQTTMNEAAHAARHAELMSRAEPADEWKFNAAHAGKHLRGALEHAVKLGQHLKDNYPVEGELLATLEDLESGKHQESSYVQGSAARSLLTEPRDGQATAIVSAPGAGKPQSYAHGPLKTEPSQTVSPSPPLPPAVDLPTPKELRDFAARLGKMEDDDQNHHLRGAVLHVTTAADKMSNNPVSALYSLRSAQMAIQQEWRYRVQQAHPRVAYVFSVNTPPAEQAARKRELDKAEAGTGEMQAAAQEVAQYIDRVRRAYFRHMHMEPQVAGGGIGIAGPGARL